MVVPEPMMPEEVSCNLCGADDTKPLFRMRDYRMRVDDIEWQAVRCRSCGLGYLNPRPAPDELRRYYPPEYFSRRATHTARYRRMADYLPESPGALLDVGTARGDFLAVMRDLGWEVEGIEPAEEAGNPHGLRIHRTDFPGPSDLPSRHYDVITAWAVFEHLRDPAAAFTECARMLRPGGRFLLQVPNLRSIWARWALQEDIPRHLYFFDPSTLRAYGHRAGLKLRNVRHTTDLFGGSGRSALRLALVRSLGRTTDDFFEVLSTPRRERFRRWPFLATAWTAVAAVERVLLADWVVRTARITGQIVAEFEPAP
jgi:SAM-dependent methyltransferase